MRSSDRDSGAGFSLIEALIASLLVASAVVGLAHLIAIGAEQSLASRRATASLTVAQSKLEDLRKVAWSYAPDGGRVSGTALAVSPPQTLQQNMDGYVDYADAFGEVVSLDSGSADYARRWAISPLGPGDLDTLILQVCVYNVGAFDGREATPAACVSGIRTRKP